MPKDDSPNDLIQPDATVKDDESSRDDAAKDLDGDIHAVARFVVEGGEDAHGDEDDEFNGDEGDSLDPAVILRGGRGEVSGSLDTSGVHRRTHPSECDEDCAENGRDEEGKEKPPSRGLEGVP